MAPRIVALRRGRAASARRERGAAAGDARALAGALARYEAARSPLDRGPRRAGRPVRARAVRARRGARRPPPPALRRDAATAGRTSSSCGACRTSATSPRAQVAHDHRTDPRAWLARRVVLRADRGAASRKRHPGKARPLHVSPWTTAAWAAARRAAPDHRARRSPRPRPRCSPASSRVPTASTALELAALGTLRSGRVVADALDPRLVAAQRRGRARRPEGAAPARGGARRPSRRSSSPTISPTAYGLWRGLPRAAHARPAAARAAVEAWSRRALVDTLAPWEDAARNGS